MNQFLDPNSSEKYIACLIFSKNDNQHYVSIDCDNKLIWNSIEEYAMNLTLENLNFCTGKYAVTIKMIETTYRFENNNKKEKVFIQILLQQNQTKNKHTENIQSHCLRM